MELLFFRAINWGRTHSVSFHKNNISSIYKHNHSSSVEKGDFVKSGQIIALSGNTGENTTGPHYILRFGMTKDQLIRRLNNLLKC